METLSALDAGFLRLEGRNTSLHIASAAIFEGPPPTYEQYLALFAAKMDGLPRYRQRVREIPFSLGLPVWVDDPNFSLRYHVRNTALPRPGTEVQLRELLGRLMSQQLDRERPLWESWLIEGLEGDRWVMVNKLHHCMADGIAGSDLLAAILDHTPESPDTGKPSGTVWQPAAEPSMVALLASAVGPASRVPAGVARQVRAGLSHPRETAAAGIGLVRGAFGFAELALPVPTSSLSGPLGVSRSWGWARTTIDDVRTVRRALGGTVNDVVLAAITRGFRDLLLARGEAPEDHVLRTLVPVSMRAADDHSLMDNRLSAMVAELPVGLADPVDRLNAVRAELDRLKASGETEAGAFLMEVGQFAPAALMAVGLTMAFRLPQRMVGTVTTNVPGPRVPLYAFGRRMLDLYPYVPIANQVRTGVVISTYEQAVVFGVTSDRASMPDVGILIDGIEEGMRELLKAAGAAA